MYITTPQLHALLSAAMALGPPSQPGTKHDSANDPAFMDVDIAIAGAGLGGLALALGLKERGITAHVFEAAPAPRTDGGTVIGFFPNGGC